MKKLARKLYRWLSVHRWLQTEGVRKALSRLHRGTIKQTEEAVEAYYVDSLHKLLLIGSGILVLCGMLWLQECVNDEAGIHLTRSDYGEEENSYTIAYEKEDKSWQELDITLEAVQYAPEELKVQFEQGFLYLEENMLGDNASLAEICNDMNLLKEIPNSGLSVTWSSEDYELISDSGTIQNAELTEPQAVGLQLELAYGEVTETRSYEVVLQPKEWSPEELKERQLQEEIAELLDASAYEKEVWLPEEIQGIRIQGKDASSVNAWLVLGFGIGICVLVWMRQKEMLNARVKRQKEELRMEYPYLVNQLLLYMEAGATVKGAFERILNQYEGEEQRQKSLYRELRVMWNEMHAGVTQEQAYMNFGKRIGLLPYMKLSSLLVQQLRKGSGGVAEQLEQEEHAAFEQRKEQAKKLGEEAGTKLLLPMILLMVISMVVVVCPALMNFAL